MTRSQSIRAVTLVILAGVCAAIHVGKLPAALPALHQALGVSLMQAGFLLSLVQLAGMALGIGVGLLADGIGLRRTMLGGLTILAAAGALGGLARHPAELMILRAVEGFGFLLVTMPGPGLIRRLVATHRLSAGLGMWSAFMPLGTALALLVGPMVIVQWGWSGLWEVLAGVTFLMAVTLAVVVPSDARSVQAGAMQADWPARLALTLTARGPWMVAICFAVYSAQWISVIGFLPTIYSQAGVPSRWTALATAGAAAVNVIGNVASGWLVQRRVAPDRLLLVGYLAMGTSAWLAFGPVFAAAQPLSAGVLRYGAVLIFSMLGGIIPGTLFALAVRVAPSDGTVSTTVGWMQQWSSAGQFVGPPLVAWVAHRTGGWEWTWVVTGAWALLGVMLTVSTRRRMRIALDRSPGAAYGP